jgi:hypothetical protein
MKIGGIGCFSFPLKGLEHLSKYARKGSREARIALMKLKMEQAIEPRYKKRQKNSNIEFHNHFMMFV